MFPIYPRSGPRFLAILPDGTLHQESPDGPAADTFISPQRVLAAPGGGVLVLDRDGHTVMYLGPPKADHLLAAQVLEGVHAAEKGDLKTLAARRDGLAKWLTEEAKFDPLPGDGKMLTQTFGLVLPGN